MVDFFVALSCCIVGASFEKCEENAESLVIFFLEYVVSLLKLFDTVLMLYTGMYLIKLVLYCMCSLLAGLTHLIVGHCSASRS